MADRGKLVQMRRVGKVFLTPEVETHALADVDLEIEEGEFLSVTGPSGCGKSTLLGLLGLLDAPTTGEYELAGARVDALSSTQRARIRNQHIGFVFQSFNLLGELSVLENVALPLVYAGVSRAERERSAEAALEKVAMRHRLRHHPFQLSGGEQQRVAVARAIAGRPRIVLADEPTGNLDSRNGDAIMELLSDLHRRGATLFVVTHDPRHAVLADRTLHLLDGRIVRDVPAAAATASR